MVGAHSFRWSCAGMSSLASSSLPQAYFSPGTVDAMTETDLPVMQKRLYCNAETATTSGTEIRLTKARCDKARREEDISEFSSGDFPTCGCFRKKGRAYWGRGGSRVEVASKEPPGAQERIDCRGDGRRFFLFRA